MRTAEFNGGTITYPDDIAFAFNPLIITLDNDNKGEVTINVSDNSTGRKYSDKRQFFGDTMKADISKYVQMMFDRPDISASGEQIMDTSKTIYVEVIENSHLFSFECVVIWGVIYPKETFNESRTVKWFRKFPQYVSVYVPTGTELQYRFGSSGYQKWDSTTNEINHVMPSIKIPSGVSSAAIRVIGGEIATAWDYTFDNTFTAKASYETIISLNICDCDEGIFLRWIDRFGCYQFWLFELADKSFDSSADGEQISIDQSDTMRSYISVDRYQGRSNNVTYRVGASMLTQDEADLVKGIIQSPMVAMYSNAMWVPVNVSDGTIKVTNDHLQDIEINIELPVIKTQRL